MSENTPEPQELDELEDLEEFAPDELDLEAPEADAAEQHHDLQERPDRELPEAAPMEADPRDVVEQRRIVEIDEDDYR